MGQNFMGQNQTYVTHVHMILIDFILFPIHLNTKDGMPTGWNLR